eukprot:m.306131 g.306131  ORF g.306131 m.306131 type:complete len:541 (+) comp40990_c0_seq1:131-1753(+)
MEPSGKKEALLMEDDVHCRRGKAKSWWPLLFCSFIVVASVFAVAFVGGYFFGKTQVSSDASDAPPQKAFEVGYDGSSQIIPAFNGTVPVEEFIQCRSVLSDGQLVCAPSNPLLTPKGAVQIFIYQHEDDVSLILTTTGSNYGESSSDPSTTGEGSFTFHANGLVGDLVKFADGYHRLFQSTPLNSGLKMNVQWGNVGSHGVIFKLNQPDSMSGSISFSGLSGSAPWFNLRGCNMHDTELTSLPTTPLTIKPYTGKIPADPLPDPMSEQTINDDKDSGLKVVAMQPSNSKKRSAGSLLTHVFEGAIAFIKKNPTTGELLHRLEFHHEHRHGGSNGTMCAHVFNYQKKLEAHTCYLFHDVLYDGMEKNSTANDIAHGHVIANFHYRTIGDDFWNHVTVLAKDLLDNDDVTFVSRKRRGFFSWIDHVGSDIGRVVHTVRDVIGGIQRTYNDAKGVVQGVEQTYNDVRDTVNEVKSDWNSRRRLLYNCDVVQSLYYGGKCGYSGFKCGSGILGEPDSGFLDTLFTAKSCYGAVNDCSDFGHQCF